MAFGKNFCANDGFDTRNHKAIAIQAIIDLLTDLKGNSVKEFFCKDDSLVVRDNDVVMAISGEIYSEDNETDFDGENDMFECFVIWVETKTCYERLCNFDKEDIEKIWQYMLNQMRKKDFFSEV